MNISVQEAFVRLRDDLKEWATNNFLAKLNKMQGTNNAGKVLKVDDAGEIKPFDPVLTDVTYNNKDKSVELVTLDGPGRSTTNVKSESIKYKDTKYVFIPPVPTETERGGIIASPKDDEYKEEVKLGKDGKLYAKNSSSAKFIYWS